MKHLTAEWMQKAEADFATMERECQVRDCPNFDGICFHAQQCIEKYLKAILQEANIRFGKIHDLVALLDSALEVTPSWESLREDLAYLTEFAVTYRYPGESADHEIAQDAQKRCARVRSVFRAFICSSV